MASTKFYVLELTKEQLKALQWATDILQRIQLGQWREITDWLPLKKPIDYEELHKDQQIIGNILSKHMIDGIDGSFSSLGIGHPDLPENNSILYDIYCVIRNKLALEWAVEEGIIENENSPRKWPEMMTVDFDPPYKWSDQPLPKLLRKKDYLEKEVVEKLDTVSFHTNLDGEQDYIKADELHSVIDGN